MLSVGPHQFSSDEVSRLLSTVGARDDSCVFVSGSLVEGYGNQGSDIDVFVVGERPGKTVIASLPECDVDVMEIGGVRYDVEYWSPDAVDKLLERLEALEFDGECYPVHLSPDELQFCHRLRIGIPIAGQERFDQLIATLATERLLGYIVFFAHADYDDAVDDALSALDAGDLRTSITCSRIALEAAIDCCLALRGDTSTKGKWRWRRLSRLEVEPSIIERFWSLWVAAPASEAEQQGGYVEECVSFCSDLLLSEEANAAKRRLA